MVSIDWQIDQITSSPKAMTENKQVKAEINRESTYVQNVKLHLSSYLSALFKMWNLR